MIDTCKIHAIAATLTIVAALTGCAEFRAPNPAVRFVAFGDSATAGPSSRNYSDILRETLGLPPEQFINEGAGGETLAEGAARPQNLIAANAYPSAEVLLFWEGGNDVVSFIAERDPVVSTSPRDEPFAFETQWNQRLDDIQTSLETAIAAAQSTGWDVYIATYFPLREQFAACGPLPFGIQTPDQAQNANDYIVDLNERIRAAAEITNAVLVDVEADGAINTSIQNYFDCNHLSATGNAIVARLFAEAITANASPDAAGSGAN